MPTSVFTQAIAVVSRESLANAKVSTRACTKAPSEEIYSKSTQGT